MSLPHILLGFLSAPAPGYHIKQAFDDSVRHFWDAKLSQIYPTLHQLHRRGWVSRVRTRSPQGPPRVVYSRTGKGSRELRRWLQSPPSVPTPRLPYLAQIFFLGQFSDVRPATRVLQSLGRQFRASHAALQRAESAFRRECPGGIRRADRESLHFYLTLQLGLAVQRARIAWCDQSLRIVQSHSPGRRSR